MELIINPESDFLSEFFLENTMQRIITAFKQILTPLCEIQKSAWNNEEAKWKPSRRALETYKFVLEQRLQSIQPIKPEDINQFFSPSETADVNFFEEKKVLYLPPLKKDAEFVPIFSLYCNLSKEQSIAKFRVMLVTLDQNDKTKLNGIGFRMEPPESRDQNVNTTNNDNTGIHGFYHAQLIQQFSPKQFGDILQNKCLSWLPESQPSFPLPANCPVTLLLCIILTLYGWEFYNNFCNSIPTADEYRKKLDLAMGKKKR
jgi:hypothetical protein